MNQSKKRVEPIITQKKRLNTQKMNNSNHYSREEESNLTIICLKKQIERKCQEFQREKGKKMIVYLERDIIIIIIVNKKRSLNDIMKHESSTIDNALLLDLSQSFSHFLSPEYSTTDSHNYFINICTWLSMGNIS